MATQHDIQPVRLAVFDFDGTIIDVESGLQLAFYLMRNRYIRKRSFGKLSWWGIRYKLHLSPDQDKAREYILEDMKNFTPEEMADILRDFHDRVLVPHYRKEALATIARMKDEGFVPLLLSATFMPLAEVVCAYAGIEYCVATLMGLDAAGRFTGAVDGEVVEGQAKPWKLAMWADNTWGAGAWEVSYAFGDHHTDVAILEKAENPVAVDPDGTLERIAKKRDWTIAKWH